MYVYAIQPFLVKYMVGNVELLVQHHPHPLPQYLSSHA